MRLQLLERGYHLGKLTAEKRDSLIGGLIAYGLGVEHIAFACQYPVKIYLGETPYNTVGKVETDAVSATFYLIEILGTVESDAHGERVNGHVRPFDNLFQSTPITHAFNPVDLHKIMKNVLKTV